MGGKGSGRKKIYEKGESNKRYYEKNKERLNRNSRIRLKTNYEFKKLCKLAECY